MILDIQQAVVHVLDTNVDMPLCSQVVLPLYEDTMAYLANHFTKSFISEESRMCTLSEDAPFAPLLAQIDANFLQNTAKIAQQWFTIMHQNPAIPAGDAIFAIITIDGEDYLAAVKMNYKNSFVHYYTQDEQGTVCNELVCQNIILPGSAGKADEAFFIHLATNQVRVVEKKYDVDGHKIAYLAAQLLGCRAGLSSKEKFAAVKQAAVEVNQQFYGNTGVDEPELAAAVCAEFYASEDKTKLPLQNICEKLYGDMPHAKEAFTKVLAEQEISIEDEIPVTSAAVRRLEKQSLRSGSGVEIKVPVSVYQDETAVEFIRAEDGTMSLLIKNILL